MHDQPAAFKPAGCILAAYGIRRSVFAAQQFGAYIADMESFERKSRNARRVAAKGRLELISRWAVQLEGETIDIDNLERKLNGSATNTRDLFVVPVAGCKAIASADWDRIADAADVLTYATETLRTICGALYFLDYAPPLKLGTVFERTPEGMLRQTRFYQVTEHVRKANDDQASPASFKALLRRLEHAPHLANCMAFLSPDHTWFNIYKAIEELEGHFGGERELLAAGSAERQEWKRAKQMANSFRHAGKIHAPPQQPLTLEEVTRIVRVALTHALR